MNAEREEIELDLLLEAIWRCYGYDFRQYSKASLRRRLQGAMIKLNVPSLSHLQHRILNDDSAFEDLLNEITVHTTEMFRDPQFFKDLRQHVLPILHTYPSINIWHAGCSSGEEVYSLAICLWEEGLYERSTLYATDINANIIKVAQDARFPLSRIKEMTQAYQKAGGAQPFSNYYTCDQKAAYLDPRLKKNMVFSTHNLATDGAFIEAQLIICRNVLIYFDRELQDRAVQLMTRSLSRRGFLCLGSKESASFLKAKVSLEEYCRDTKIYRKIEA